MGYRTIAINQILDDSNCEPKKKKKKGDSRDISDIVPLPVDVKSLNVSRIIFFTNVIHFKFLYDLL